MQRSASILLLCLMFCAPFVLVGLSYRALPQELPVLRFWIGHVMTEAPKSLFMVFRVPTMNLIHGLMAAVMLSHSSDFGTIQRRASYWNMFSTLAFTIALKSDLEGFGFFASTIPAILPYSHWIGFVTLTCVVVGLALACIRGAKVTLPWPDLRLAIRDKIALCGLFAMYVAIVIGSLAGGHRV